MEIKTLAKNFTHCKTLKILCIFALCQIMMLLVFNLIPLGDCEWASECREWIVCVFKL